MSGSYVPIIHRITAPCISSSSFSRSRFRSDKDKAITSRVRAGFMLDEILLHLQRNTLTCGAERNDYFLGNATAPRATLPPSGKPGPPHRRLPPPSTTPFRDLVTGSATARSCVPVSQEIVYNICCNTFWSYTARTPAPLSIASSFAAATRRSVHPSVRKECQRHTRFRGEAAPRWYLRVPARLPVRKRQIKVPATVRPSGSVAR